MRSDVEVSIVLPALNEAADIRGCLEAIAAQSYPIDSVEVVLADACSDDDTVAVATRAARELGLGLVVVPNPARRTSCGLNAALAHARGRIVVRVDARSRIRERHVELAVRNLDGRTDIGVVGGGQQTAPRSDSLTDRAIARALRNRFSTGLARYRRSRKAGPADTVWMGSFRRADLERFGGWSEAVALNEDWDLAERYRQAGFAVWFDPAMDADYLPRQSFGRLARQYFRFGRVKGTWWARGRRPSPRQAVLLLAPPVAIGASVLAASVLGVGPFALLAVTGLLALDAVGTRQSGGPLVRIGAIAATTISCGAWWIGVAAGAVGEVAGVQHAHG